MADKCVTVKKEINQLQKEINGLFKLDVEQAYSYYFPMPGPVENTEMHKYWQNTKDLLTNYAYEYGLTTYNGRIQNIGHFFRKYRDNVASDVFGNKYENIAKYQDTLGWNIIGSFYYHFLMSNSIADPFIMQTSKNMFRGINKQIADMIKMKENGFKEKGMAAGLKPKAETFFWLNGSELINRLIRQGDGIDESALKKYKPTVDGMQKMYRDFTRKLESNLKPDLNEYIIGDITGFYHGENTTNNEIQILRVNYKKTSRTVESITAKYLHPEKHGGNKDAITIPIDELHTGDYGDKEYKLGEKLLEKGLHTFIDDIMAGQIQYWVVNQKPSTSEQTNEIGKKIKFDNLKKNYADKENEKLGDYADELDIGKIGSSPYVKMVKAYYDGKPVNVYYTTIKRSETEIGEKYDLFIIKHQFENGKVVHYYNETKDGWKENTNAKQLDVTKIEGEYKGKRGSSKKIFENGFHKAYSQKTYGEVVNENGKLIKDSTLKGWDDFRKLDDNKIPNEAIKKEIDILVNKLRVENENLFDKYKKRLSEVSTKYKLAYSRINEALGGNLRELTDIKNKKIAEDGYIPDELRNKIYEQMDVVDSFFKQFGIKNSYYIDKFGKILFPFENMNEMKENYTQINYTRYQREDFLREAIRNAEGVRDKFNLLLDKELDKSDSDIDKNKVKLLEELTLEQSSKIAEYDNLLKGDVDTVDEETNSVRGTISIETNRHRLPTNEMFREKTLSSKILKIKNSYKELERLDFLSNMLDTVYQLTQNSKISNGKIKNRTIDGNLVFDIDGETIENIVNYSKVVLKTIDSKSKFLGIKTDYESVAKRMNARAKLKFWKSSKAKQSDIYTPERVRFLINQQRAFFTQNFIGTSVAIANSTQHFLPISTFGRALHQSAIDAIEGRRIVAGLNQERWEEICATGGAGNILKVFLDMLSSTAMEVEMNDGMSVNYLGILKSFHPTNTWDYTKLLSASKDKWYSALKNTYKDSFVLFANKFDRKANMATERAERMLQYARSEQEEEAYRRIVDMLYEITHMPQTEKSANRIKQILINANIDAASINMKKFVEKTMNYRFDRFSPKLKELTSFQETELYNHKITYIMALLAADKFGILGYTNEDRNNPSFNIKDVDSKGSRFESTIAIEYGRNAIKMFQFMHSMAGTGEWSWNRGSTLMQFKQFAYNRERLTTNAHKMLKTSSKNDLHMLARIFKEDVNTIRKDVRLAKNWLKFRDSQKRDKANQKMLDKYGDEFIDYEARKYVFFRNSAMIASIFSFVLYNTAFLPQILSSTMKSNLAYKGVRGLESPIRSIGYNAALNIIAGFLIGLFAEPDDDDDKSGKYFKNAILDSLVQALRVGAPLLPVYIIQQLNNVYDFGQKLSDWINDEDEDLY